MSTMKLSDRRQARQETPRPDRRADDGLQGGADRGRRRLSRKRTSILRKRGLAIGRQEGRPHDQRGLGRPTSASADKIGILVEVNCESDFVARTQISRNSSRTCPAHRRPATRSFVAQEDVTAAGIAARRRTSTARRPPPPASRGNIGERLVEGKWRSATEEAAC